MNDLVFTQSQPESTHRPVTVLGVEGRLDGSNYEALVTKAQELFDSGVRDLLLDLGKMTYISSAGISALHRVALLFQGKKIHELEEGWAALRAIDRDGDSGVQQHVKLLNPTEPVQKVLEMVGFSRFFEIHSDLKTALGSY